MLPSLLMKLNNRHYYVSGSDYNYLVSENPWGLEIAPKVMSVKFEVRGLKKKF